MASEPPSSGKPAVVTYAVDAATDAAIGEHLRRCDALFNPRLSERLDVAQYAAKIRAKAVTFEAWSGDELVGLLAAYLNEPRAMEGFVTNVSVEAGFQGSGIGDTLMHNCIRLARDRGFREIGLEVHTSNERAVALYRRHAFEVSGTRGEFLRMTLSLGRTGAS
jgi:ribosomal protein S18 acetylase RimI-like enzyme